MKINNEQIEFFQKANKILQHPGHFPDGNKVYDEYHKIFEEEIKNKVSPYYRSLTPSCGSCIRFMTFAVANKLKELKIIDNNGDFIQ